MSKIVSKIILVLLLFFVHTGISVGQEAQQDKEGLEIMNPHFVKEKEAIKLLNTEGNVIKSIKFGQDEEFRTVTSEDGKKEIKIRHVHKVTGNISENGEYAAILTRDYEHIYGFETVTSSTSSIRYIDKNNEVLWEKPNIDIYRGVKISQNGDRIAFIEIKEYLEFAPPVVEQWVVVCDKTGKELFKTGSYREGSTLFFTRNGKYGYFKTVFPKAGISGGIDGYIVFNVDSKEIYKLERPDGAVLLSEDGVIAVEKGRKVYLDGRVERGEITYIYKFK